MAKAAHSTPDLEAAHFFHLAPLDVRRVLEIGPGDRDLADGYGRINPAAEYCIQPADAAFEPDDAPFDLIFLRSHFQDEGELTSALPALVARLAAGGHLLFRAPLGWSTNAPGLRILGGRRVTAADGSTTDLAVFLAARAVDPPAERIVVHFRHMAVGYMDIRTTLPTRQLARDPGLVVSEQPGADPFYPARFPDAGPKVLVTQRPKEEDEETWLRTTAMLIRRGWISVIEVDDHPNFTSAMFGKTPTEATWRYYGLFHAVQTSTDALAEAFRPYNPNIAVFPNAVFDLPPLPVRQGAPRVFYGGMSRGPVAAEVAASLTGAAERFPEVQFIVVGDDAVFDALPTANKRRYDLLPYADYLRAMSLCEVSLSPLAPVPFIDTKSDAKYLDAARTGAVTIASPTVYERTIRHGHNGLIARSLGDWDQMLCGLLADAGARARMGEAARADVRDHRMFAPQAAIRRDWYRSLWERREELNAELIARVPALRALLAG